ncbi:hypothetical protein AB0B21_34920 [Streptomyces rimosus]|uniref:hypothetical protein n=1 Tax=Streptomyces rimosus TaxID=1927 RepID=UPI000518060B|nr:hypothetical protein [Streptomyces rimosus]
MAWTNWTPCTTQFPPTEELKQQIVDIESGKTPTVSAEEVFPELAEYRQTREAMSEADKAAEREQLWREREERDRQRDELSRRFLEQLERLTAGERAFITHLHADRKQRHRPAPPV